MKKHFFILLSVWTAALAISAAIVKLTAIGPVIFVISEENGWGVHEGDKLCLIPLTVAVYMTIDFIRDALCERKAKRERLARG